MTGDTAPEKGAAGDRLDLSWCSVIVPVYEHWHLVPELLQRLTDQTIGQEAFEVLLVNNGARPITPPNPLPDNARLLQCDTPGSYAARNLGINHARGRWLVFTDADCRPDAGWLASLRDAAEAAAGLTLLAGAVTMTTNASRPNAFCKYDLVKGIPQDWYVARGYATTANLAVPAAVFAQLGRFNAARFSGADAEFCRHAVAAGIALRYVPEAVVEHPARDCWQALATKARRVKGGQLSADRPRRRLLWWLRTFTPPVIAIGRFMANTRHPLGYRLVAVAVQMRIWAVEMREALQLLHKMTPERR